MHGRVYTRVQCDPRRSAPREVTSPKGQRALLGGIVMTDLQGRRPPPPPFCPIFLPIHTRDGIYSSSHEYQVQKATIYGITPPQRLSCTFASVLMLLLAPNVPMLRLLCSLAARPLARRYAVVFLSYSLKFENSSSVSLRFLQQSKKLRTQRDRPLGGRERDGQTVGSLDSRNHL